MARFPVCILRLRSWAVALVCALAFSLSACDVGGGAGARERDAEGCIIPEDEMVDGCLGGRDCFEALTDPPFVDPDEDADRVSFLEAESRVIGLVVDGQAYAVPHNILWWHEVANVSIGDAAFAVTHCALTGSSLVFDRSSVDGAEFGVEGLLFKNNLVMYDRTSDESLWPQMHRKAGCGPRAGDRLQMVHSIEMTWAGWQSLYPEAKVAAGPKDPGQYARYQYGDYDEPDNDRLLVPMDDIDERRPPKERVLGVPDGREGGVAFPFGALSEKGDAYVVEDAVDGERIAVFWDRERRGAMAYRPFLDGERLSFVVRDEKIVDAETESTWRVDGTAVSGPLQGRRLEPFTEAYVAFWFAWAAFHPHTKLWEGS